MLRVRGNRTVLSATGRVSAVAMPSDIAEGAREDYGSSDTLSSAEQNAAAVPGVWEEELMSQRDVSRR